MHAAYTAIDTLLIWFYRITGNGFVDFLIGTFVLASLALIVGEFSISLAFLASRKYIDRTTSEVVKYQNLSVDALVAGDKESFKAANKLANDAFGRSFFMQIALSAGLLWPVFFAVAWMDQRFSEVRFQLLFSDYSLGHVGVFIALYAAAYLIFKRIKYKLPYFRRIKDILDTYGRRGREMKTFERLIPLKPDSENQ